MSKLAGILIILSVLSSWLPQPTTGANNDRYIIKTWRQISETRTTTDLTDSGETDVSMTLSLDPTTERLQYDVVSPDPQQQQQAALVLRRLLIPPRDVALNTVTTLDKGTEASDKGFGRKYPEDRLKNTEYDYEDKEYRRQMKAVGRQYNHQDKKYGHDGMEYSRQHKQYNHEDKAFRSQSKDYKYQDKSIQYSHQGKEYNNQDKGYLEKHQDKQEEHRDKQGEHQNVQEEHRDKQGEHQNIQEEHQDKQEEHQDMREEHRDMQEEYTDKDYQRHDKLDHQISWRMGYSEYIHGYWDDDAERRQAELAIPEHYADGSIKQRRANPGLFSFSPCETWLGTGYRETCCMGRWLDWPTCLCYGFNACLSDSQSDQ